MKVSKFFFVFLCLIGCNTLPEEGEIIENKLTGERYEVDYKGDYQGILSYARTLQSINQEVLKKFNSSRNTPVIFVHSDQEDSLANLPAIMYEGNVKSIYYRDYNKRVYTQELHILTADDFEKKYKVVE